MVLADLESLPELTPPDGVSLRTYVPGDEEHWARIMEGAIGSGWSSERCLNELVQRTEFSADGCFFAEIDGIPEGSATAWRKPGLDGAGYVHMVAVTPKLRGRGVGRLLTLATLHWFRSHGFHSAILNTDDWRLPAIGSYLGLGFEPEVFDDTHAARWEAVRLDLAARRRA